MKSIRFPFLPAAGFLLSVGTALVCGWTLGQRSAPPQRSAASSLEQPLAMGVPSPQPVSQLLPPLTDDELTTLIQTGMDFMMEAFQDQKVTLGPFKKLGAMISPLRRASPAQLSYLEGIVKSYGIPEALDYFRILSQSARGEPTNLTDFAASALDPELQKSEFLRYQYAELMRTDPFGLIQLALQDVGSPQPKRGFTQEEIWPLFAAAAKKNYAQALELAIAIPDTVSRREAMNGVGKQFAHFYGPDSGMPSTERDALLRTYLNHPRGIPGDAKADNFSAAVTQLLRTQAPEALVPWYEGLRLPAMSRSSWADAALVKAWATQDPSAAYSWRIGQAPPSERPGLISQIIGDWTYTRSHHARVLDPLERPQPTHDTVAAAADWLTIQGTGPAHASAVSRIAEAYLRLGESAAAQRWLAAIDDETLRQKTRLQFERFLKREQ